jgi:RNA polymerase sigma-54 factor
VTILLSLATRQNQTISPRMQQAIRLLRLSAVDFECALRSAAATNPFLESPEDGPEAGSEDGGAAADDVLIDAGPTMSAESTLPATDGAIPDSFAFERPRAAPSTEDGPQLGWVAEIGGLREHLRAQLYASQLPQRQVTAAEVVIDSLDEDGYLREDLDFAEHLVDFDPPLGSAEIEAAISVLQRFDPPGVGARSLVECLLLQLASLETSVPGRALAAAILDQHIELLARRNFYALRSRLECTEDELREAIALIRRLDPAPASRYTARPPEYIAPDVLVVERGGRYVAVLNPAIQTGARLNDRYISLFRQCRRGQHPAMAQQLQEARWLMRGIEQRFETILRVAELIVERQQAFFSAGDIALKPMVLREVADALDMHESTVSRATANKYMATQRGCLEFKHFFTRELPMRRGPGCSAAAVRSLIQSLIDSEARSQPLSDVALAAELQAQGVRIARRTVTKYRRMLKLPPAEFRKAG